MTRTKVTAAYRIVFLDARGKQSYRGKRISLKSAKFFALYYGKRRFIEAEPFTGRRKSITSRQNYLNKLIGEIEKARQRLLAEKRAKARAARERARIEAILRKERLDLKRLVFVQSKTGHKRKKKGKPNNVVGMTQIVPILTKATDYTKEIIQKKVKSVRLERLVTLQILDFKLKEAIRIDEHNYKKLLGELKDLFAPHLLKFFRQSKNTARRFIFRIKFEVPSKSVRGEIRAEFYGFSRLRFDLETISKDELEAMFEENIEDTYSDFEDKLEEKKYFKISMDKSIYITGFTLENILSIGRLVK